MSNITNYIHPVNNYKQKDNYETKNLVSAYLMYIDDENNEKAISKKHYLFEIIYIDNKLYFQEIESGIIVEMQSEVHNKLFIEKYTPINESIQGLKKNISYEELKKIKPEIIEKASFDSFMDKFMWKLNHDLYPKDTCPQKDENIFHGTEEERKKYVANYDPQNQLLELATHQNFPKKKEIQTTTPLIIIVGKKASGKNTLVKYLCNIGNFNQICMYTTQQKNNDYSSTPQYHVNKETFSYMIKNNKLFDWQKAENNLGETYYYGYCYSDIKKNSILITDKEGIKRLTKLNIPIISFYLDTSDKAITERIKNGRNRNIITNIDEFLKIQEKEFKDIANYVTHIINGNNPMKYIAEEIITKLGYQEVSKKQKKLMRKNR